MQNYNIKRTFHKHPMSPILPILEIRGYILKKKKKDKSLIEERLMISYYILTGLMDEDRV